MSTVRARRQPRRVPGTLATYGAMALVIALTVYPMIWMVFGSLKSSGEFYTNIWSWPHHWQWHNFSNAWNDAGLGTKFVNSLLVTAGTLVLVLPLTAMAGYAFARVEFPFRRFFYWFVLVGIMIPFGVSAIPVLTVVINLGLFDTRSGLVLVYVAQSLPFGVFLMHTFFQSIPAELEEAALVDGCGRFGAFLRVIVPLARPGLATLLIFVGTSTWNEYFMASVLIHQPSLETLPLGLVTFTTQHATDYPTLFAALAIVTAPVVALYIVAQRQFISGLTAGAVKG